MLTMASSDRLGAPAARVAGGRRRRAEAFELFGGGSAGAAGLVAAGGAARRATRAARRTSRRSPGSRRRSPTSTSTSQPWRNSSPSLLAFVSVKNELKSAKTSSTRARTASRSEKRPARQFAAAANGDARSRRRSIAQQTPTDHASMRRSAFRLLWTSAAPSVSGALNAHVSGRLNGRRVATSFGARARADDLEPRRAAAAAVGADADALAVEAEVRQAALVQEARRVEQVADRPQRGVVGRVPTPLRVERRERRVRRVERVQVAHAGRAVGGRRLGREARR